MRIRRTENPKLKIIEENHMTWICDVIYNVTCVQISNRNSYKKAWNKQKESYMRGNITENVCLLESITGMFFFKYKSEISSLLFAMTIVKNLFYSNYHTDSTLCSLCA
jgi:hypothetical protein